MLAKIAFMADRLPDAGEIKGAPRTGMKTGVRTVALFLASRNHAMLPYAWPA
jgi:hypothetical protein